VSPSDKGPRDEDDSTLDEVPEEEVEQFEEGVDTQNLDEDDLVSLDDAARSLLAKPPKGHGPIARLYRGETRFDFVGRRRVWFALSTIIILLGVISIVLRGGLNLGIEFKGGTEWTIAAPGITQTQATNALSSTGLIDPTVELLGSGSKQTLNVQSDLNKLSASQQATIDHNVQQAMLKLTGNTSNSSTASTTTTTAAPTTTSTTAKAGSTSTSTTPTTAVNSGVPKTTADKISVTTVGPTWGSSITNKAIEALIIFFVVVAIYISFRFEPKMALAAFIAMIHDVLVAIGIFSIFNFQVTPDTVVAILTILGYSLYDTVVVFDRVRDNTRGIGASGRLTYPQLINLSMNQTLARSINTSAVAIIPVLAILVIGAQILGATTLQSYGLALFVGLLSGAYSSIFIASPVLCMMKEREARWRSVAERQAKRGNTQAWYSAVDAANMSTQMSIAAAGQVGRSGRPPSPSRAAPKRSGPIRPGSATGAGNGNGSGSGNGTGSGGSMASVRVTRPYRRSGAMPPATAQGGGASLHGRQAPILDRWWP
jgi:preprotein translocase subunit SecF